MRRARALTLRVLSFIRRGRLDRELVAELESHVALHTEDNIRRGMPPHEARRAALLRLGGLTQTTERYRDRRGMPSLDSLLRDLRLGWRMLRRSPTFTTVAVLSLALGIGANATVFSVLSTVALRPLPVERPDELVMLNRGGSAVTHSYPDYVDFRDRNSVLSGLVGYRISPMSVDTGDTPVRIWGYLATGNYFDVLGVRPVLGRAFGVDDDHRGAEPVIVLSHRCWQRLFGGDPAVVGRSVTLNSSAFSIIGVMPPEFRGTELFFFPDVWVPMARQPEIEPGNAWLEQRQTRNMFVLGRVGPGVSVTAAEAALNAIAAELGRERPAVNDGLRITLSPPGLAGNLLRGPVIAFSVALLVIAGLVLLLACTNVTGVLLARVADNHRRTAVCLALGARRTHLVRQSLAESALLSGLGTIAAVGLAYWIAWALPGWRPPIDFPLTLEAEVDARVLLFSATLAVVVTLLLAFAPVLQTMRSDVLPALKDDGKQSRVGWRLRDLMVAGQMAISAVLLIASLLVLSSLRQATQLDLGFRPEGVVAASVDLGLQGYDPTRGREFQRRVLARLAAASGVESATLSNSLPLTIDQSTNGIFVDGRPEPRAADVPYATYYQIAPRFFHTLQTPLVLGREFNEDDSAERPRVAVVNEAFVKQILPSGLPLGMRFRSGRSGPWIEVVGVVATGKYRTLGEAEHPAVFYPIAQRYNSTTKIVVRGSSTEREALDAIRRAVREEDAQLSLFDDGSLTEMLALPLLPVRVAAGAISVFGAIALVLVSLGTYAQVSFSVSRRTREICIRLAIGASAAQIARLVLARAMFLWLAGAGLGAAAAFAGSPLLGPVLLNLDPRDPITFALAGAILFGVTAAACWVPARRAVTSDPAVLLRSS